jgi:hypothetical protein
MPSIRALHYPTFCQWCASFCALWTPLDVETPPSTMLRQPGCPDVMVILLIRKNQVVYPNSADNSRSTKTRYNALISPL